MDPVFTILHIVKKMHQLAQSRFIVPLKILVAKLCVKSAYTVLAEGKVLVKSEFVSSLIAEEH
jgi:hypothetical protein